MQENCFTYVVERYWKMRKSVMKQITYKIDNNNELADKCSVDWRDDLPNENFNTTYSLTKDNNIFRSRQRNIN